MRLLKHGNATAGNLDGREDCSKAVVDRVRPLLDTSLSAIMSMSTHLVPISRVSDRDHTIPLLDAVMLTATSKFSIQAV